MPFTILHGENTVQSRQKLHEMEATAKAQGQRTKHLETKTLTPATLEEALAGISLFAEDQLLIIEELHSLPKSARQTQLIQLLSNADAPLILWEKRSLTKTMLAQFPGAITLEHKVSSSLFKWLETLSPLPQTKQQQLKLFHEALLQEDEQLCFLMLIRQVRLLIQAKDGGELKGAPFMITKLRRQANAFTLEQLLQLHAKLTAIDLAQKTSTTWQRLSQELDILTLRL